MFGLTVGRGTALDTERAKALVAATAAAEQQLKATQAQWGVAQSALFPQLTLAGSLGLNAGRLADVLEPSAFVFNLGAFVL